LSSKPTSFFVKKFEEINPTTVIVKIVTRKPIPGISNLKMLSILLNIAKTTYMVAASGTRSKSPSKKYLVSFVIQSSFGLQLTVNNEQLSTKKNFLD
jgi:hypothetical protein